MNSLTRIYRLATSQSITFYVFFVFAAMLLIKYLLILNIHYDFDSFLKTFKFVNSDSYDWVANGIRIFENESITYRSPALVLLISVLDYLKAPFIMPLITNVLFFVLVLYVYKISLLVSTKKIALFITIALALNYSFNLGANYLLADLPTTTFIAMSIYYFVIRKYFHSIFLIGISILFQNIGYLLLLILLGFIFYDYKEPIKNKISNKDYKYFFKKLTIITILLLPAVLWNLYKLVKFGDPLYSKIGHLELLTLNLNSINFYIFNMVAMFSFLVIILILFIPFKYKIFFSRTSLILLVGFIFNILFWIISYEWDDRRFLIYFIPFIYPLIALMIHSYKFNHKYHYLLILLLFYPTFLPVSTLISSNELPIAHNAYLKIDSFSLDTNYDIKKRAGYDNLYMNFNPTLYNAAINYEIRNSNATTYNYYSDYIELNYDPTDRRICYDKDSKLRLYLIRSILQIRYNINTDKKFTKEGCEVKLP